MKMAKALSVGGKHIAYLTCPPSFPLMCATALLLSSTLLGHVIKKRGGHGQAANEISQNNFYTFDLSSNVTFVGFYGFVLVCFDKRFSFDRLNFHIL